MGSKLCKNNLLTQNFELAKEWHPTKNGDLTPEMVTAGSNKKVWWLGECGHEWKASIKPRNSRKIGCPICAKEMQTSFPEQAIYYYMKSKFETVVNTYTIGNFSEIDVYIEELKLGIEYDGARWHKDIERDIRKNLFCKSNDINLLRIRERNCPALNDDTHCIVLENNSIIVLEKAIKAVFNYISQNITGVEYVIDIDIAKDIHNIHNLYVQSVKENSLSILKPEHAREWHPKKNGNLIPEMVKPNSHKKVWWLGKCGHEWQATISNKCNERGCPICAGKQILIGYNDLATTNYDLSTEWHSIKNGDLSPKMVTAGSEKKVWWLGKCGHEWESRIDHRRNGAGCPICSGQKVLAGYNDLLTTNPELSKEWHPTKNNTLRPSDFTGGSEKKVWWLGKCGHEWESRISHRNKGVGCPICLGQKTLAGYNDLSTTHPELAKEWHPTKNGKLKPTDVVSGSGKKVWWLNKSGREWQAIIGNRSKTIKNGIKR